MKQKKTIFPDWLIGILLTLLISGGFFLEWYPLRLLEYKAYDLMTNLRQHKASSPVVIVTIDDVSIATLMFNIANTPHVYLKELLPNVPDCCVYITDKLLAKDIEERYQRGRDVVNKINSCMGKMG